jgi:hypothetical protein
MCSRPLRKRREMKKPLCMHLIFQMSHMGTYVCDAIDHREKDGSTVSVYLRVIQREYKIKHSLLVVEITWVPRSCDG